MELPPESLAAYDEYLGPILRQYAAQLNARSWRWPFLSPTYHTLADALYWIDEAPPWPWWKLRGADGALRCLWHYRTGLIIGETRPFEKFWTLGKRLFPKWVGFHPSRCQPLHQYKVIYRAGHTATVRCLVDLKRQIEEQED
jgi:hypothetical protein